LRIWFSAKNFRSIIADIYLKMGSGWKTNTFIKNGIKVEKILLK